MGQKEKSLKKANNLKKKKFLKKVPKNLLFSQLLVYQSLP